MRAVGDNIVLEEVVEEHVNTHGLSLSSNSIDSARYLRGRAVAVGGKAEAVKVGDEVAYNRGRGGPIVIDGKPYVVVRESDVVVVY